MMYNIGDIAEVHNPMKKATIFGVLFCILYERPFGRKGGETGVDEKDVEHYMRLYRRNVLAAALCYVKNYADADDIMQDVFFKLYTYNGVFTNDEHVKAWLVRCAINQSKNLLGSRWYRLSLPLEAADSIVHYDHPACEAKIPELLRKLRRNTQIVLYMYYYENYSAEEISEILGISKSAVNSRLKRGRQKLKKLLTDGKEQKYGNSEGNL